jgi:uncharacterized protein YceK
MLTEKRKFRRYLDRHSTDFSGLAIVLMLIIVLSLTSGCARIATRPMPGPSGSLPSEALYWWYARFRMVWQPETDPQWHLDLLIARQVLQPVIEDMADQIPLWRFHRRAAPDAAGHQFSFIFYATPATAEAVYGRLAENPTLQLLYDSHLLARIVLDNPQDLEKPEIEDTSDSHWSPAVQKSWPYFAMGASQTWLQLITQLSQASPMEAGAADAGKLSDYYRQISTEVDRVWQQEGRHAYLHHLSAIFGYRPLALWKKLILNF